MKYGKKLVFLTVAVTLALAILLIPVTGRVTPVRANVTWTKGSAVTLADSGVDELYVLDSCVIKDGTTYKMWYTHVKTSLSISQIVTAIVGAFPTGMIGHISNLQLDEFLTDLSNITVSQLMTLLNDCTTVIGYATSTNGTTWTVIDDDVFTVDAGFWNSIGAPCVVKDGTTYKMWYTGLNTTLVTQADLEAILTKMGGSESVRKAGLIDLLDSTSTAVYYATSTDGTTWSTGTEVLAGTNGMRDSVGAATVVKDGDTDYKMWYTIVTTDITDSYINNTLDISGFDIDSLVDIIDGTSTAIYYTTSTNGTTWSTGTEVLVGDGSIWQSVADPCVVNIGSYGMWYTRGSSTLTTTTLGELLDAIAAQAGSFWTILDDFSSGDLEALLTNLAALDITDIKTKLAGTRTVIAYATSSNGSSWTVADTNDLTGTSTNLWSSVAAPSVVKSGTTYQMWYTEGISDLTAGTLLLLGLGTDSPIGYASYTPSTGGGGGGGGAPPPTTTTPPLGLTNLVGIVNSNGIFIQNYTAYSYDGGAALTFSEGTKALTVDGEVLREITMVQLTTTPPEPPEGIHIIGLPFKFSPDGAVFEPPAELQVTYDPSLLPDGVDELDLVLAYWDTRTDAWIELEGTVNTANNTITAKVSHFTIFAVLSTIKEAPPVVGPPPEPAAFQPGSLVITPAEVVSSQSVTISIAVTNTGGESGKYEVILKINDIIEATKEVIVAAGAKKAVSFRTTKDVAGIYSVEVNGLTDSFTVKEEVVAPTPEPPPSTNWMIIIVGIIIAVAAISLLVGYLLWRRRYVW